MAALEHLCAGLAKGHREQLEHHLAVSSVDCQPPVGDGAWGTLLGLQRSGLVVTFALHHGGGSPQLTQHPAFLSAEALERENRQFVVNLCQANLTELHERLKEALRCLGETQQALGGLKSIGLTARYMAFCIASEAAGLAEAEANFKNLATEITRVVDDLDGKTLAMKKAIEHGQELLDLLLKGYTYAK